MDRIRQAGNSFTPGTAITVTNAAVAQLVVGEIAKKNLAVITVESNPVRFKVGSDPTTSDGTILNDGDTLELDSTDDLRLVRFIATGSNATLNWHVGVG